ncbi:MAG: PilZ domain-containing protein [Deltaproteobacteria bacterium]|nr:PilZ domain-containing protein [Deltaproteobacteria bacterium]
MSDANIKNINNYPEGRRDRRFRVQIPVTLSLSNKSLEIVTGDVSLRGLFLITEYTLKPSQFIRMDIILPFSNNKISLFGSVAYFVSPSKNNNQQVGAGVELYGNGPDELLLWKKFILELEQRFPQAIEQKLMLDSNLNPNKTTNFPNERRRFQRFETEFQVRGYFGEIADLVLMYTRDISKGGMFIKTNALLEIGSEIELQLVHPVTHLQFPVSCVVRRIVSDRSNRGMGVEFVNLDDHRRNQLWDFISSGVPNIPKEDFRLPEATNAARTQPTPIPTQGIKTPSSITTNDPKDTNRSTPPPLPSKK